MFLTVTLSLLEGFLGTIKLFVLTLLFSLPLGLIISFGSMSKIKLIKCPIRFIIWIVRGTPLMLQLLIIYYGPGIFLHMNIWGTDNTGSSHDIEMVNQFADKIFVLYDGVIIAEGDKHQIFSDKELLRKAHLKAPVTTEILYKLKENGLDVDTEKIGVEEPDKEILKAKKI